MPKRFSEPRRSTRERHAVYTSLEENCLGIPLRSDLFNSLIRRANKQRHRVNVYFYFLIS